MNWGLAIAGLAGLILAAPWGIDYELNYVKLGVKLVILDRHRRAARASAPARQRKDGSVPPAIFWSIGILTLSERRHRRHLALTDPIPRRAQSEEERPQPLRREDEADRDHHEVVQRRAPTSSGERAPVVRPRTSSTPCHSGSAMTIHWMNSG